MKLKEAIEKYKKMPGSPINSYEWYRRNARLYGKVSLWQSECPVYKKGGQWYIDDHVFEKAWEEYKLYQEKLEKVTKDFENKILHGDTGDLVKITWGYYRIYKDFYFVSSTLDVVRKKSYGTWYCRHCHKIANTEHEHEECHTCSDWGDCGQDCTLSRVYCESCGVEMCL